MNSIKQPTIINMEQSDITEVAEQFVLCYYRMMHESPDQLHRFYQNNSSMIYEDTPVFGQKNIHNKFMHLNLDNNSCVKVHVLQLDALKAHDKIVIQVAGEISANDCEWRRFMQSFVLGEVSSNNFFVVTDIFRFQDRVFADATTKNRVVPEKVSKPTNATINSNFIATQGDVKVVAEKPVNTSMKENMPVSNVQPNIVSHQNGVDHNKQGDVQSVQVGHKMVPIQTPISPLPSQEPKPTTQQMPPPKESAAPEAPIPHTWAQMASSAKSKPNEQSHNFTPNEENNESVSQHRGNDRVNSGRGGMRHGKSFGDRERRDHYRGDRESHGQGGSRGGHMRGGGAIAVGGNRKH